MAPEGENRVRIVVVTVDGRGIPVDVKCGFARYPDNGNDANALSLSIEQTPEFVIQKIALSLGGFTLTVGDKSFVGRIVNALAPSILPPVLNAIGAIPLPAIADCAVQAVHLRGHYCCSRPFARYIRENIGRTDTTEVLMAVACGYYAGHPVNVKKISVSVGENV